MSGKSSTNHVMKIIRPDEIKPKEKLSYIIKNCKYKIEQPDKITKPTNNN